MPSNDAIIRRTASGHPDCIPITDRCIAASLDVLQERLMQAYNLAANAREAMTELKRNRAIGTVLPLEQLLPEATALLTTILLLHRSQPVALSSEVAS